MDIDFDGKVYLVTGGASGIGAAVVHYLARHHGCAVIADINNEAGNKIITNMASGYQKEYAIVSGNPIYDYTKFVTFEAKYSHQAKHSYSVKYAKTYEEGKKKNMSILINLNVANLPIYFIAKHNVPSSRLLILKQKTKTL